MLAMKIIYTLMIYEYQTKNSLQHFKKLSWL